MLDTKLIMYGLDDLIILPAVKTKTIHRSDASVTNEKGKLPIFVAPMPSIINESNYKKFEDAGLNVIIPRTVSLDKRLSMMNKVFIAVGLDEFSNLFCNEDTCIKDNDSKFYICIDIANGHMEYLHNLVLEAKIKYRKNLILMVGNVANAELYLEFAKIGVDYIRVGIGGGSICTTSVQSGCHVTLPNLINRIMSFKADVEDRYRAINNTQRNVNPIDEENGILDELNRVFVNARGRIQVQKKKDNKCPEEIYTVPKIIADGGINTFAKINKLLALGADFVMLGNMLVKTEEACAECICDSNDKKYHVYYGMSTKKAQLQYGVKEKDLRLEEGIEKLIPIEYTLKEFVDMFSFNLREAMSLTNCSSLDEFGPSKVNLALISNNAFNEFNSNK